MVLRISSSPDEDIFLSVETYLLRVLWLVVELFLGYEW